MTQSDEIVRIRAEFIEKIGVIAQSEGLPRIAGRVLATLVYDGERVSFGVLADRLKVSRGSISSSVRLLEERQVIRRVAEAGDRQVYFEVADDAFMTLTETSALRARRAYKDIAGTLAKLPLSEAGPHKRLKAFADFYDMIDIALSEAAKQMKKRQ